MPEVERQEQSKSIEESKVCCVKGNGSRTPAVIAEYGIVL
jgi:hypothetical protein